MNQEYCEDLVLQASGLFWQVMYLIGQLMQDVLKSQVLTGILNLGGEASEDRY